MAACTSCSEPTSDAAITISEHPRVTVLNRAFLATASPLMDGAHRRTIQRALDIVVTKERLAAALNVPMHDLKAYLQGEGVSASGVPGRSRHRAGKATVDSKAQVVDDNVDAQTASPNLELLGHTVRCAYDDGASALSLPMTSGPKLSLRDIGLPRSGWL